MENSINVKFLRAAISGICFLAISFGAVTQMDARTFLVDDFASYKAAVTEINNNNSGADTIRIVGDFIMTSGISAIKGDVTIIGDTNPDGTPKYTVDGKSGIPIDVELSNQNYCNIENIQVTNSNYSIHVSIKGYNADNYRVKIHNCVATDSKYGIHVSANNSTTPQKVAITNCIASVNQNRGINTFGIQARNPEDFIIHNCVCNNNGKGIDVLYPENITISDCVANENTGEGILITGSESGDNHIIMDNCRVSGNQVGIDLWGATNGKTFISNSIAGNNGIGFSIVCCQLINCVADDNEEAGFNEKTGYGIMFDKCVAMNNGGDGFNCPNSLISNSTAVNNKGIGINGCCFINCTSANNESTGMSTSGGMISSGKIYNSITYGNGTDIANNSNIYNSVYATGTGKEILNCTQNDPKLQGKTATGENTTDPSQTVYYALGDGSSALGLADKSWITTENIMNALSTTWFPDNLTEEYLAGVLLYDQIDHVRQFNGNRYDAGSIASAVTGIEAPPSPPERDVRVYPNPTDGLVTICDMRCAICDVEIFDVMGRIVAVAPAVAPVKTGRAPSLQQQPEVGASSATSPPSGGLGGAEITFDLSNVPAGIYFIRITTDDGVVTRKVVKK